MNSWLINIQDLLKQSGFSFHVTKHTENNTFFCSVNKSHPTQRYSLVHLEAIGNSTEEAFYLALTSEPDKLTPELKLLVESYPNKPVASPLVTC